MTKSDKIYIAGHRGLVGSAIVRRLQKAGYENLILRSRSELELTEKRTVDDFFATQKPDYVFLAAAKVGGIHANDSLPADFIYENLTIQNNILHAACKYRVKRLLFLGSSCIYPRLAPQPMREEYLLSGPLEPTNSAYAVAKIAGIEMCYAFNKQYKANFVPVMPTNLYGPNDNYDLMNSHVMPAMIRKFHLAKLAAAGDDVAILADTEAYGLIPEDFYRNLMQIAALHGYDLSRRGVAGTGSSGSIEKSANVTLWGTGTPKREFLYVDDLANALVFIMFESETLQLINIGTGVDQTIRELAEGVRQVVGYPGGVEFDVSKPDGMPRKLLDISRLKALGWQPQYSLEEGVQAAYENYLEGVRN